MVSQTINRPTPATRAEADVRSILDSVRRIVRELRLASRASEKAVGLSAAQLFVLQKLAEAPAQSLNELAARTRTDQSSVSVVVRRLAEAGLVRRRRSGTAGRRVQMSLTAKARRLLEKAPGATQEGLIAALHRLPEAGRRPLARLLKAWVTEAGLNDDAVVMFFEE
jgi:DNA-binding MarR family transcriptional regulator